MPAERLIATYRVQFRPEFTLEDAAGAAGAAKLAGYLARLGVSHLYASPYLQSAPGSTHGYDVVDYNQVNQELGGEQAHTRLVEALQQAGLGQVLDIVPNHMAISPRNPWWWDVLENGPSSRYAAFFDVEWDPPETRHANAILLPVLGDQYGRVLEAGEIHLEFAVDTFTIRYHDQVFPVDPDSLGPILSAAGERSQNARLAFLASAAEHLPDSSATDRESAVRRDREKAVLRGLLGELVRDQPGAAAGIQAVVAAINADPDALDDLLGKQNYRLALWKISAGELGYRRFFDINSMIGLRMEDAGVFEETHTRVIEWLGRGVLDGARIDHPDGLRDPQGYFERLRATVARVGRPDAWVVVEKILEPGEHLPHAWPVDGTTGYDFLSRVLGLLVDTCAEEPLTHFYTEFTGERGVSHAGDYYAMVREKKLFAARELLGSDLNRLTELLLQISERHRCFRDYTRRELRDSLAELAAALPVYRTYIRPLDGQAGPETVSGRDQAYLEEAAAAVKASRPDLDPRLVDFLLDLFFLRVTGSLEAEFVDRFQQFTGPVMAKGVEDTTFYNFNRFVALNEVGCSPGRFGLPVEAFHQACAETLQNYPRSLLATSTHDTKRSEDVRARLAVLSEIPEEWQVAVQRWSGINETYRQAQGFRAVILDRNTEYLFYQTLVGAWPLEEERAQAYMLKAAREAKAHTSWTVQDAAYEEALAQFVTAALADKRFMADMQAFVSAIQADGWVNSLAQTLLKLTTPGIPDIYQGCELWDYSLVDPDNRRPVDYALRARLLEELQEVAAPEAIWARAEEGLPKLWLIQRTLALRHAHPEWFDGQAGYTPLPVEEDAGVAFLRGESLAVVVPRLARTYRPRWGELDVSLPEGQWRNVLNQSGLPGGRTSLRDLLGRFPVALLVQEGALPQRGGA
jgi:(1->4)-alpha-D-glucan 1-alpha-D-glucosylmutase